MPKTTIPKHKWGSLFEGFLEDLQIKIRRNKNGETKYLVVQMPEEYNNYGGIEVNTPEEVFDNCVSDANDYYIRDLLQEAESYKIDDELPDTISGWYFGTNGELVQTEYTKEEYGYFGMLWFTRNEPHSKRYKKWLRVHKYDILMCLLISSYSHKINLEDFVEEV